MENNRRFPRSNMGIRVEYVVLDESLIIHEAKTRDISVAGVSIRTSEMLNKGALLDMKFYLPKEEKPIGAISKVMWTKEIKPGHFESGIEFVKISFEDQMRIGKFIA